MQPHSAHVTYLCVNIVADLAIRAQPIVPPEDAIWRQQLHDVLCEELLERGVVFGKRVVVDAVEDDALRNELRQDVLSAALVDVHVGLVVPALFAQARVDLGMSLDDVVLGRVVRLDGGVNEAEAVADAGEGVLGQVTYLEGCGEEGELTV
jgi:hypothetical protein